MDPSDELQRLCYGGEELLETVTVRRGAVGVTTHRVLILTPDGPGARFAAVDLPNVTGVTIRSHGPTGHRNRAIAFGTVGAVLYAAGAIIEFGGSVQPIDPPAGVGFGGLLVVVNALIGVLDTVDAAVTLAGLLALAAALGFLGWYLRERNPAIEVDVAGAETVEVPVNWTETEAADRLRAALDDARPGSDSESSTDLR